MICTSGQVFDAKVRTYCCKELADELGTVVGQVVLRDAIWEYLVLEKIVRYVRSCCFAVDIARASLEYRSVITMTCLFPFAARGGPNMSIATKSKGSDGGNT